MLDRNDLERAEKLRSRQSGVWRHARQILAWAVVGVMVTGSWLVHVEAAPGSPDRSFSTDGKQITSFSVFDDHARAIAIQANGKIVVAGFTSNGLNADFALARYNGNGSLDTSFSTDGKQITSFSGGSDVANAIAIQSDGKIIAAGYMQESEPNSDFALARYNSDGALDTTFDTDGKQTTNFSGGRAAAEAMAIQPNGKIVLAGSVTSSNGASIDFALARYNTDGTLDTTFSTDGKQTTNFGPHIDHARAIAIQANGKIVAAGYTGSSNALDFALARYNGNGSLDATFSTDGKLTTDFSGENDLANDIAIQSNGKIVVAGDTLFSPSNTNFALARYNANGTLDTTFSTDGKQDTDFFGQSEVAYAVVIQSDGKIVAAGSAAHVSGTNLDFALARYNSDGTPDVTFSIDGKQSTNFFSQHDVVRAMAIQTNGKIVVAGSVQKSNSEFDFGLARYIGN